MAPFHTKSKASVTQSIKLTLAMCTHKKVWRAQNKEGTLYFSVTFIPTTHTRTHRDKIESYEF